MSALPKRYYRQICHCRIVSLNIPDFKNILPTVTAPAVVAVHHPIYYYRNTNLSGINSNYQSKKLEPEKPYNRNWSPGNQIYWPGEFTNNYITREEVLKA